MEQAVFVYPELTKEELEACLTAYQSMAALCLHMYTYADAIDDDAIYAKEGYSVKYMIFSSLKSLICNMFDGGNNKLEFLDEWHLYRVNTDDMEDNQVEIEILKEYQIHIGPLNESERHKYSWSYCEMSALRENILSIVRLLLFVHGEIILRKDNETNLESVCDMIFNWKYALTSAAMHLWHILELVRPYHDRVWKAQEEYCQRNNNNA